MSTTYFFETKDQYTEFLNIWGSSCTSKKAKRQLGETQDEDGYRQITPAWQQAEHFLIYNVVRGRSIARGFTPCVSKRRQRMGDPMYALKSALNVIKMHVNNWNQAEAKLRYTSEEEYNEMNEFSVKRGYDYASYLDSHNKTRQRYADRVHEWLAPFGGTVTPKDLDRIVEIVEAQIND